MSKVNILLVDDEVDICDMIAMILSKMDIHCMTAHSIEQAYPLIKKHTFILCLADMHLPDGKGSDLVRYIQQHKPELPVAVITAYGNVETAVESLKAGAFDYVMKPINLSILKNLVNTAKRLAKCTQGDATEMLSLMGQSLVMQELKAKIRKVARSQAPVFIGGESGSGKELVARLIHSEGPRSHHAFVPVNCGAIPMELMESEFFGHKKGSFTGAVSDKIGLFQAADGGTLFLDEITDLPLSMQVKLLRAIQEKAIRPIGSQHEMAIDVRLLSASHRSIGGMVEQGDFRQDLYYRIHVIEVQVPNLAQRKEDIPMLSEHMLKNICASHQLQDLTLSKEALASLQTYSFPGNVRELENILERAATLCEGDVIQANDLYLPQSSRATTSESEKNEHSINEHLDDQHKNILLDALEKNKWNRTAAAKSLGITLRAMRYRLKKFGIE